MNVDGVILAAGYSSRANAFKMELKINNKPILKRCIESLYDECNKIIVVSGYQQEKIHKLVEGYSKVKVVFNEDFHKGMFSSVKKGIQYVEEKRFLITPGDYPLIKKDVVKRIVVEDGEVIIPSFNNRGGHPILIKSKFIDEILKENDDSNLKKYLSTKKCKYLNIKDKWILMDVDTQEDYIAIRKEAKKSCLFLDTKV
ncbi:nucleotidyltransferase family protein [Clostridium sp. SHJSY1]|uniref:nucleotidyltransferase family protein n=1 Tax=Clostridium sp. SHJSY1 TaxID=2942483 RepID=UPI002876FE5C|nr:nucleotidyltransferase family protein [Clostridium sp. SHJSY1]MDS0524615.1 nucleotidyltransferase family protein [Clostridium sp. SHJSY1]